MACKGWKGGAIKIQKKSKIEYYRKKVKMKCNMKQLKVPLGQGMMVCKGWKGGTIKKILKYQRKVWLNVLEKNEDWMQFEAIKRIFGLGYDGL